MHLTDNIVFADSETTAKPLHDPFNPRGKLCYYGLKDATYTDWPIAYGTGIYGDNIAEIQKRFDKATLFVGANPKFDINWSRRYGIVFNPSLIIWDVLLTQFLLNHQTTPFTSLNAVLDQWGLERKLDIVKTEYWDKGIDTMDVPEDILRAYLKQDVVQLEPVFWKQYNEVLARGILPFILVQNQDIWMLAEMEWNGLKYDQKNSLLEADKKREEQAKIIQKLDRLVPSEIPTKWNSPYFLSAVLYGGVHKYEVKEPYTFTYKDGSTKEKIHKVTKEFIFPPLVKHPRVGLAKEGFWPTDEATLKKLKATGTAKKIINAILEFKTLETLNNRYLEGFPKKIIEHEWENDLIHTNFNQAVAVTGRLSSDDPNVQNNPAEQKQFFISRFN